MSQSRENQQELSFEEAMSELEEIARGLEDGNLGLTDSLAAYERGIGLLKQCHTILCKAENRISLLTSVQDDGTPVTEILDEEIMSLEEKQEARSRRRSQRQSAQDNSQPGSDMDTQKGLF